MLAGAGAEACASSRLVYSMGSIQPSRLDRDKRCVDAAFITANRSKQIENDDRDSFTISNSSSKSQRKALATMATQEHTFLDIDDALDSPPNPQTGLRILTLDGGGIRGIVELTILQQLEHALGHNLHIQDFFDLIVGTSTGGIIALGLGACGRSVESCIRAFRALCKRAFTRRGVVDLSSRFQGIMSTLWVSRYRTGPLEEALRGFLGEENLASSAAGGRERGGGMSSARAQRVTKVAVPTTTAQGSVVVLANYTRRRSKDYISYRLHRAEAEAQELKIWEAARATSAAPGFFRPFFHAPSGMEFIDGAIYHNNPVEIALMESKLLWPELAGRSPDLVLSLGTGFSPLETGEERGARMPPQPSSSSSSSWRPLSHIQAMIQIAIDHVHVSLDAERAWKTYLERSPPVFRERFIRVNPAFEFPTPDLDDASALDMLEDVTRWQFRGTRLIRDIADRLIASSFYFRPVVFIHAACGAAMVKGDILCRFAQGSRQMRALGEGFRDLAGQVYFVIREKDANSETIVVDRDTIRRMITKGIFGMKVSVHTTHELATTEILLCRGGEALFPISEFPRCLFTPGTGRKDTPVQILQDSCCRRLPSRSRSETRREVYPTSRGRRRSGSAYSLSYSSGLRGSFSRWADNGVESEGSGESAWWSSGSED